MFGEIYSENSLMYIWHQKDGSNNGGLTKVTS